MSLAVQRGPLAHLGQRAGLVRAHSGHRTQRFHRRHAALVDKRPAESQIRLKPKRTTMAARRAMRFQPMAIVNVTTVTSPGERPDRRSQASTNGSS